MADRGDQQRKPRGRGWGRGRAGAARQDAPAQQARRPGQEEVAPPPQMPPPAEVHPPRAGGRRTHRGVPREDPPSQASVAEIQETQLQQSMAAMSIETQYAESAVASGRGRSHQPFVEQATRPANLNDKRGTSGEKIGLMANYFEKFSFSASRAIFSGLELFSTRTTDDETIRLKFKFVAELAPSHPELQRLFNTQMRRNLRHMKYQLLGRHYFDQNAISEIPQFNLQIWQGVITSIRTQEEKLMMSVDTVHKVVRRETALQIITDCARTSDPNYRENVARELVGCVVMTKYNNRTYSVEDVDWNLNPTSTFESKEGPRTYLKYYKQQYDINIQDLKQPLLLCKSKEKEIRGGASVSKAIYLVPELCCMTGLTESMRSNFAMMREMATKTRLDPSQRVKNLQTFINRLSSNENVRREMEAWHLSFADRLVQFPARVLPPERIVLNTQAVNYVQSSGDFSKEMRGKPMYNAMCLDDWLMICPRKEEEKARDFLTNLYKVCPPMGMRVRAPKIFLINDDRPHGYLNAVKENLTEYTKLICFIVSNNKKERYDALKKHTCLDNAVASQVIVARTLAKRNMLMSVATKIGIQLNCKLGGEPWALEIPFKMKAMVIGYDTYHDSSRRGRSAGAFVASMNQSFTQWYSKVTFHSAGGWEELSNYIRINFTAALRKFNQKNNCLPDLILYYRDGVGDGQIPYVIEFEVNPCKAVMKELIKDRSVRFAFTVVNKKINTRFFYPSENTIKNPPPGTLVDHTVTRYDRYDFYLVSQCVRQGTVAPTQYNVIEDTSGLKPEYLQRISYKLTHLYFNWPGTIRVPAPCQYAHKLAFLAGQSLHQEPREELTDTLFYL
ncbi:Piwi-like protein 1 like protein [Argiope bruennichi]|uniref:Piwi-like protein 1 like protein n=1 Tax=Argiope bruennichi TaxID=94029 RepID=A0A8T0DYL1_ARGBR|nr:Piwi-like protein 1 like protein [Argiope bruennichi]